MILLISVRFESHIKAAQTRRLSCLPPLPKSNKCTRVVLFRDELSKCCLRGSLRIVRMETRSITENIWTQLAGKDPHFSPFNFRHSYILWLYLIRFAPEIWKPNRAPTTDDSRKADWCMFIPLSFPNIVDSLNSRIWSQESSVQTRLDKIGMQPYLHTVEAVVPCCSWWTWIIPNHQVLVCDNAT